MTSELRIDNNARNNINLKTGTHVQYPGKIVCLVIPRFLGSKADQKQQGL